MSDRQFSVYQPDSSRYDIVLTAVPLTVIPVGSKGLFRVNGKTLGTWERVQRGDYLVTATGVAQQWGDTPLQAANAMVKKLANAGRLNALIA